MVDSQSKLGILYVLGIVTSRPICIYSRPVGVGKCGVRWGSVGKGGVGNVLLSLGSAHGSIPSLYGNPGHVGKVLSTLRGIHMEKIKSEGRFLEISLFIRVKSNVM